MKQALLVIDVQESFRRRPYFRPEELPAFLANVQSLIDRAPERGIAVVQVFHQEPGDDPFQLAEVGPLRRGGGAHPGPEHGSLLRGFAFGHGAASFAPIAPVVPETALGPTLPPPKTPALWHDRPNTTGRSA